MPRRTVFLVHALFFLSGAAGLVYQVVWSRLLNEVFGVTAHAVTAVLAAFLGGLALGSWALGRASDRHQVPLRLYGWLELGVAATALAGSWLPGLLDPVHVWLASRLASSSPLLLAARSLLAAAVVLPPTFLMGGTLPAMIRALVGRIGGLGRQLSFLYALNTTGAVAGSLLSGFVLIRTFGLHPTLWLAVGLNVLVGGGALLAARAGAGAPPAGPAEPASRAPAKGADRGSGPGLGNLDGIWLPAVLALSGFASLSLEVVWTRLLVLVVGTSTYAFVTMLSAFLVGIALGSFLLRLLVDRLVDPRRAFGWLLVATGAATLATIPVMREVMARGDEWLGRVGGGWVGLAVVRFAICFLVMLVPTTLIGATFPLASRIWARRLADLGGRIGQLYAANTAGNIAGALVGGFVLLPGLGMQRSIAVAAALFLAAAGWGLLPASEGWRRRSVMLRAAPVSLGLWACIGLLLTWRPSPLPGTGGEPLDVTRFYEEGLVSTVKVFQRARDGRQLVMAVDGVTIGQSWSGVDGKQQVLAHLPFVIAPPGSVRDVISIGLGTGILIGEVARHLGIRSVECVEISDSVITAAHQFDHLDGRAMSNPAIRVIDDDGVNFLHRSRRRYDAIIADGKSRSGHAGNAVFYSEDFYRMSLDHLTDHGIMVQWVPLDVTPDDLRIIVRTFLAVFPHSYLWFGNRSCFLVGLPRPLAIDLAQAQRVLSEDATADLRRHGWQDAQEVAGLLIADQASLARWVGTDGPVNSLERPILEFYDLANDAAPEPERIASNHGALARLAGMGVGDLALSSVEAARLQQDRDAVLQLLRGLASLEHAPFEALAAIRQAAAAAPGQGVVREVAGEADFEVARSFELQARRQEALFWYREAFRTWPDLVEAEVNAGRLLAGEGRTAEAMSLLGDALRLDPEMGAGHRILGLLLQANERHAEALEHLEQVVRLAPADAEAHEALGLSRVALGRVEEALASFVEALRLRPDWRLAMARVAYLRATAPDGRGGDRRQAASLASRALGGDAARDPRLLEIVAATYQAVGQPQEAAAVEQRVLDMALRAGDRGAAEAARAALERYQRAWQHTANRP